MKRLSILCSLLLVFVVSPLFADCSSADKKALEALDRAWGEAGTKGDRSALEQIYASDYMNMALGNAMNRADTIDTQVRDAEKSRGTTPPAVIHDYYLINCTPVSATITHRNTIANDGQTLYTRSVHFLEKRNGKWQVVANAGNPLSDSGAVAYLEHEWNDADMKNDQAWFEKYYATDLTAISGRTGKMTNKAEEIADMKTRKGSITSEEITDLSTRKEGDTVVATGVNHVKGIDGDGKAYDRRTAYTDVWVKRDGRWQVVATQGTDVK